MIDFRRGTVMTVVGVVAAAGLSVTGASRVPAAADPPTGGTTVVTETFTGTSVEDPAWTAQGDACLTGARTAPPAGAAQIPTCAAHRTGPVPGLGVTPGYLQLTDTSTQTAGSVLYNRPIPATAGVTITFDQFQYGGTGADGIGFFLVDGSTDLTETGGAGGSLGYAQRRTQDLNEPGVVGGVLGVGLDAYGNFYDDGEARGAGCPEAQRSPSTAEGAVAPHVITLRGPGEGSTGYCYLASTTPANPADPDDPGTTLNGGTGTLRAGTRNASWRQVNITVTPAPNPRVVVQIRHNPGVAGDPWITELDIPAPQGLPSTYKFGLSGSTGGLTDVHLIRNAVVRSVNPLAALQLEKQVDRAAGTLPAIITAGTVIPYQYTVTNAGQEDLSALSIADDTIDGPITCEATTLTPAPAPGSTTVCRGTYTVTAADVEAGEVVNIATATARNPDDDPVTSPEATVTVPLVSRLDLDKSVVTPAPYEDGQEVEYLYTVTNTGGSTITNLAVTDDRVTSEALLCAVNVLAPGASTTCTGTYTVDVTQTDPSGNIVNTAVATGDTPAGQEVTSPEAQASIGINTDIAVTKTVDDPQPSLGDTVTFTVTATNNGPAIASDVVITDQLPDGLTLLTSSTAGTQPSTYAAGSGAWSIPALAVGNSVELTITARVDTVGPLANTASLASLAQIDINPANDTDTATLNGVENPALEIRKTARPRSVSAAGQRIRYTFRVTNTGDVPLSAVEILEDRFTGAGELPTPTCPPSASSLAPGASIRCTTVYVVTAADLSAGRLRNVARATGDDPLGEPTSSPPDGAVVEVEPPPAQPAIRTRTSDKRVRPGERFYDRVRLTGLARGTSVPATARLHGPFASRAAATCRPSTVARTVRWRAGSGWSRTPAVQIAAPGVYTWRVTTRATSANRSATSRCGLAAETTTVAKPSYGVPVVNGGFSGILPGAGLERGVPTRVRARGFGLDAPVVPTAVVRGEMRLSGNVGVTSWLRRSARYGDTIGATVVAGHVSDRSDRPGAMWGLRRAERGQVVTVASGGRTYRYRVVRTATYERTRRLPRRFFSTTGSHRLVLISCSDRVVNASGRFHYTKSKVVVAVPVRARK
ncbi:lectin-like domain-containing protein [Nocardioides marmotae]|uniref:DUF7507 domain-containing protein n=1 Tax=Nocardioides marmotae TaxID=2663857 RepID=UPI0012B63A92|nr:sortase [Nocardioides marmotae]MBC9734132.1 DUF11 domain-containing protein [Nocardioides marmotae]MTB85235.1 DUF11 domain-containing protein [Nocardioides marmotae]